MTSNIRWSERAARLRLVSKGIDDVDKSAPMRLRSARRST